MSCIIMDVSNNSMYPSKSMDAFKRTQAKAWTPAKERQQKLGCQQKHGSSRSIDASKKTPAKA
jgi:hypothetical protein